MVAEWKINAVRAIEKGVEGGPVHPVVIAELLEQNYIKYVDGPKEIVLTEKGIALMKYVESNDFASKRY